jgi:hypothetical protein
MTTTPDVVSEEFYFENGSLTQTGRFLVWLAEGGPKRSRELLAFPGWSRGYNRDVVNFLEEHGFITVEVQRNGRTGHPPTVHAVTTKGKDWADILWTDYEGLDPDVFLISTGNRKHYSIDKSSTGYYVALCDPRYHGTFLNPDDANGLIMCAKCRRSMVARHRTLNGAPVVERTVEPVAPEPEPTNGHTTEDLQTLVESLTKRIEALENGTFRLLPV